MSIQPDLRRSPLWLRWISQAAGVSAILIGGLVLVGWWFDSVLLASLSIGPPMKANTALAFVLAGISLWFSRETSASWWSRRVAQMTGSIVALIGLLALGECLDDYLVGQGLGIDQLLLQERGNPILYLNPGRMSLASALNFLLLGGALLLLDVETRRGYQPAPFLAVMVVAFACLTLMAYIFNWAAVHQSYPFATVAPHAAVLFVIVSIGVLCVRPRYRLVSVLLSDTAAAAAMRRLMLLSIALPVFMGWVRLKGERLGFYEMEFGLAVMVLFAAITLTASIYWQTTSLIRAEEYQRGINEVSALLSRSVMLESIFPRVAAVITTLVPCDRICVVVREGERLVAALSFADSPLECFQGKIWRSSGNTAVEWVMAHKTPRLIRDLPREQTFADEAFVVREGIHSTLIMPLLIGGEAVGSIVLDSRLPGAYTQDHVAILSGFMEPLASAVRNAQLYAQVVRYTKNLERLVEERTRELQTANGHLAEVSRHKSNFLTNMSHELRTPLNSILGFAQLLRDQVGEPLTAKQTRYADHIHTSGRYLLTLINDLLDLSKVEAGKLTLRCEPFVLSEALTIAIDDIRPIADTKRLTIVSDVDAAPIILAADPVRFKQIVYNLLSNAVKFTPEGGRITVTARVKREAVGVSGEDTPLTPPFVEIAVTDTGIGITAEDLPRLFERFSQLETETTKRLQGSGLGLALTRQLVELHGGTIAVESAGPGQGSRFTVRLALTPDAGQGMGEEQ